MKRYLLFSWSDYYPQWGFRDFCGDFDTIEECEIYVKSKDYDWVDIVDIVNKEIKYSEEKDFIKI
jgi:hypothetical protein